jgi:hypothetical protein
MPSGGGIGVKYKIAAPAPIQRTKHTSQNQSRNRKEETVLLELRDNEGNRAVVGKGNANACKLQLTTI